MTLQARLTAWSIAIMAVIVGFVSVVDLNDDLNTQFQATLDKSDLIGRMVYIQITRAIEHDPKAPVEVAVREEPELNDRLVQLMTEQNTLAEIAICDARNRILADTTEERIGKIFEPLPSLRTVVRGGSWREKLRALWTKGGGYQIEQPRGFNSKEPLLIVRMVVDPALVRSEMLPAFKTHTEIALASIVGAMLAALLFSTFAFRPLGRVGRMLDLLAKGEYGEQVLPPVESKSDEVGAMASKVSLLGQQLRGAHYEFSDLKDNFERLLNELEDAVLIFGRDRRLIAAAGAVEPFLSRPRGELLGLLMSDIFPPSTSLGLLLAQAMQIGRAIHNRRVPIERSGGAPVFIALLSVEILEGRGAVGPGAGVLIRLRDPEATRQIGRQLQTADRLSAISRLTGGVAHEVKNPLNAMMMHVELARMKLAHGDYDVTPQMDVISGEIMRLDRVVKTFLDFTRPVVLNLTDVPLETLVNEIADLARPQAQAAGIDIVVEQNREDVSITADADLLKQAFLNIVVNAIEAMPDGGTLRMQSHVRGDDAEISIADTGPGISPEVKEKIYNLYFTTKEHGSGIGLAMTFRIVQLHDGTIDVVSEPGKGTTFVLRFPVAVLTA